jgi:hypothetical protein
MGPSLVPFRKRGRRGVGSAFPIPPPAVTGYRAMNGPNGRTKVEKMQAEVYGIAHYSHHAYTDSTDKVAAKPVLRK